DGRLREGDQLLAIDGQPLDISHQQAIHILQSAQGPVEIVVARGPVPPASGEAVSAVNVPDNTGVTYEEQQPPLADQPTDSTVEDGGQSPGDKTDMVLISVVWRCLAEVGNNPRHQGLVVTRADGECWEDGV
ncbi:hypothetical protein BaRGS_00012905, partial [Batillaria attramentaria]